MNNTPEDPTKRHPQEHEEPPDGELPGLDEHNRRVLGERSSRVVDSILPTSPTDEELRGKR